MKKFYAFLLATVFAAVAYADDAPDLSGYWDFTGIVNTGGNWSADKASADPSTLTFAATTTDNTNYTFAYVGDNSRTFKGRVVNDGGQWWLYVDKDPRGPQLDERYLQVECGMINTSGGVGGYYNFRFSIDENGDEIGQTVQMAMVGTSYAALLSGYSPIFSWDSYADGSYGMGSRQILWAFIFQSCEKGAAPVVPTITITDSNVEETATSATVTASVNTADLPVGATVSVEYAVVADKAQQADYTAMTLNDDQYEATISFDSYAPGEYFVMVKATAKSGEDIVASAGPEEAGSFTVTETSDTPDLSGYWNFTGIVNTGGNWSADKASADPSTLTFAATTTDNTNYTFAYVGDNSRTFKGRVVNDGDQWWLYVDKDPRGPQLDERYLQVECGMINASGGVGGYYNFRFSIDENGDEIGQTVQMAMVGTSYAALLPGYSPIFSWDSYADGSYGMGSRQILWSFIFQSCEKGAAPVVPTITITDSNVEETATSATVTASVNTADLPVGATVSVEYAVVADKAQQADYTAMTLNDDQYEATISFDSYAPGEYFVMVKATAKSGEDVIASAGPEEAGSFTVTKTSGIDSVYGDLNGAVRFYNLQGIEVNNPVKGFYIKVENGKSTKVLVK